MLKAKINIKIPVKIIKRSFQVISDNWSGRKRGPTPRAQIVKVPKHKIWIHNQTKSKPANCMLSIIPIALTQSKISKYVGGAVSINIWLILKILNNSCK